MKFFNTSQIRELDQYTIEHEPISSIDLMERAARALCEKYLSAFSGQNTVCILAGPGNNGGDALALAGLLLIAGLDVKVVLLHLGKLSDDCETNKQRLLQKLPDCLIELKTEFIAPKITNDTILIDGLFGSGLTRTLNGIFAEAVSWINQSGCQVVSIDIPSGLQGEENPDLMIPIVKANRTFSLQFPKLSFLLPENAEFVGDWDVLDIGIHPKAIEEMLSHYFFIVESDITFLLKKRPQFSHKGTFGNALIVSGSKGMAGASVLSGKAALRSGAGLVTVHGPECNRVIVQSSVPEIIFNTDKADKYITEVVEIEKYNAVAVGPGIGAAPETVGFLRETLNNKMSSCVLDADALNIIGQNKELLVLIPKNSILTPHPKEFERLFGLCRNSYERMLKAQRMAQKYQFFIVLKGRFTLIATPDGNLYFNSTGNSGMATAGTGDVLTGLLTGLLAQGYTPENASKIAVYIHGLAGNIALENQSKESLIAGDIIESIGKAFLSLHNLRVN